MVMCDAVWRDPSTGKFTILGTFTSIGGHEFPLVVPQITVYLSLTDARGKVPIKLKLIDAADEDETAVAEVDLEVEFPDPIVVMDVVAGLGGISIPKPGEYRLQLYGLNEFVIERRILVIEPPKPNPPEEKQ